MLRRLAVALGHLTLLLLPLTVMAQNGRHSSSHSKQSVDRRASDEAVPMWPGTYWLYEADLKWQENEAIRETVVVWKMEVVQLIHVGKFEVAVMRGHLDDLAFGRPPKSRSEYLVVRDGSKYSYVGLHYRHADVDLKMLLTDVTLLESRLDFSLGYPFPLREGICVSKEPPPRWDCWISVDHSSHIFDVKGVSSEKQFVEYTESSSSDFGLTTERFVPSIGFTYFFFGHGHVSMGNSTEANVKLVEYHPGRPRSGFSRSPQIRN